MSKNTKPQWPCLTPPLAAPSIAKAIREKAMKNGAKIFVTPPHRKWGTGKRPPGAKTLFD
jgi:hypothetical protein